MKNEYQPRSGDGTVPAEDDSRLRYPADTGAEDADVADDPEADQRAEHETPARDRADDEHRLTSREGHLTSPDRYAEESGRDA